MKASPAVRAPLPSGAAHPPAAGSVSASKEARAWPRPRSTSPGTSPPPHSSSRRRRGRPGSDLVIRNVGVNPTRTGVLAILRQMGADVSQSNRRTAGGEPVADLRVRGAKLRGIDVDPALVPLAIDEFPAVFAAAATARGATRVTGAGELRVKESDRIAASAGALGALGASVHVADDGMAIDGGVLSGGEVDSAGDHRIAMAFAAASAEGPVRIRGCRNVATSFPGFPALANSVRTRRRGRRCRRVRTFR